MTSTSPNSLAEDVRILRELVHVAWARWGLGHASKYGRAPYRLSHYSLIGLAALVLLPFVGSSPAWGGQMSGGWGYINDLSPTMITGISSGISDTGHWLRSRIECLHNLADDIRMLVKQLWLHIS